MENAEKHIALAESKKNNHQALTKEEAKWLHSKDKHNYADYFRKHSLGYVHGQENCIETGMVKTVIKTSIAITHSLNMIRTKVTQIAMVTMYCAAWLIAMNELLQNKRPLAVL